MTDIHTDNGTAPTDPLDDAAPGPSGLSRRSWLGLAGVGAGAVSAALLAGGSHASAINGDPVTVGGTFSGDTVTSFENTTATAAIAGPANAVKGIIANAGNGSHAVLGTTAGDGHAVAGVVSKLDSGRAATWGRHLGAGAGAEGENMATNIPIAGPANGVRGVITADTNGSHAVLGQTAGGGHAIAGDIEASAPNTVAATWGRHKGAGAGIGGISVSGYGGEFVGGKASVRLIPNAAATVGPPTDTGHQRGELVVDAVGDVYYNVSDGPNFTRLNSQGGTTLLVDPTRAFDSRTVPAKFAAGEVRKISLLSAGVPGGARGAVINLTVTQTDAGGFLTAFNGDSAARPDASSVNWFAVNSNVANSLPVAVGANASINVYSYGAAHVIVDVIGYIL